MVDITAYRHRVTLEALRPDIHARLVFPAFPFCTDSRIHLLPGRGLVGARLLTCPDSGYDFTIRTWGRGYERLHNHADFL